MESSYDGFVIGLQIEIRCTYPNNDWRFDIIIIHNGNGWIFLCFIRSHTWTQGFIDTYLKYL